MPRADEQGTPGYLRLLASGELGERVRQARDRLACCELCARRCRVDRSRTPPAGACRTGTRARVASAGPHHGEERPLSGRRGSGTIFFAWCNLGCVFCQNWQLSHQGEGREVGDAELAELMLGLQAAGCHNINLVTPSHVIPQLLAAVAIAAGRGLRLPLVYNTGGYDAPEGLALLDGVVDIYLPDMKFADSMVAAPYLGVADYAEVNRAAVREMHRQVGDLLLEGGIARRGLLVRHLVLPDGLAGSEEVLAFLARLAPATAVNLMDQYRPCFQASDFPPLDRRPRSGELRRLREFARQLGLRLF